MISMSLPGWLILLSVTIAVADSKPQTLFDFTGAEAAKDWQTVNDGVMGGVSEGNFKVTGKTLEFYGTLSLENNGGFTSVRTKPKAIGLEDGDAIVTRVRGDGREYTLNLYIASRMRAFSYRVAVPTKKDSWIEVKVPLDKFEATAFGEVIEDAGAVKPGEVNAVGFLLSDKKAGPFKLEVAWIKRVPAGD